MKTATCDITGLVKLKRWWTSELILWVALLHIDLRRPVHNGCATSKGHKKLGNVLVLQILRTESRENKFTIKFWKDTNGGFKYYIKSDKEGKRKSLSSSQNFYWNYLHWITSSACKVRNAKSKSIKNENPWEATAHSCWESKLHFPLTS